MKNAVGTGIVRRIDDLGRVVIPKEIRRTHRINEGDPLEIFSTSEGILFKPYRTLALNTEWWERTLDMLEHLFPTYQILLMDRWEVLSERNFFGSYTFKNLNTGMYIRSMVDAHYSAPRSWSNKDAVKSIELVEFGAVDELPEGDIHNLVLVPLMDRDSECKGLLAVMSWVPIGEGKFDADTANILRHVAQQFRALT